MTTKRALNSLLSHIFFYSYYSINTTNFFNWSSLREYLVDLWDWASSSINYRKSGEKNNLLRKIKDFASFILINDFWCFRPRRFSQTFFQTTWVQKGRLHIIWTKWQSQEKVLGWWWWNCEKYIEAHKILWLCTHKIGRGSSKEVMREILNSL